MNSGSVPRAVKYRPKEGCHPVFFESFKKAFCVDCRCAQEPARRRRTSNTWTRLTLRSETRAVFRGWSRRRQVSWRPLHREGKRIRLPDEGMHDTRLSHGEQACAGESQSRPLGRSGVLLYYKYIHLGDDGREIVKEWYERECLALSLRGRVRVARDGVNCTLGGALTALRIHIDAVKGHAKLCGEDIDFKLSVSRGPRNMKAAVESGFTTLSVKAVKEVVSIGPGGAELLPHEGGPHVSPGEFHSLLEQASERYRGRAGSLFAEPVGTIDEGEAIADEAFEKACATGDLGKARSAGSAANKETVLLDVRNIYETSIGHFSEAPVPILLSTVSPSCASAEGVERFDPKTRQFSDLPKWVDDNVDHLRGKRVLMYCTGGVRCEVASALVRQRCDADATQTEVLQLAGGIERYLQAFPNRAEEEQGETDGGGLSSGNTETQVGAKQSPQRGSGFFRGKNFVFDERVSVPESPVGGVIVGRCTVCKRPWDDYGSRSRCSRCRILLLLCNQCEKLTAAPGSDQGSEKDGPVEDAPGEAQGVAPQASYMVANVSSTDSMPLKGMTPCYEGSPASLATDKASPAAAEALSMPPRKSVLCAECDHSQRQASRV